METLHNANPTRNISEIAKRERLTLTLAGIIIAIICSLIFLHDANSRGREATRFPSLGERSKIVLSDLPLEVKKVRGSLGDMAVRVVESLYN